MKFLYMAVVLLAAAVAVVKADDDVVFKSDVALSRVDAQVVDRDGRAVTGLQARDFVLRVDGKVLPIKNFDSESMPIDILLLLDVSGSMGPHVERIAEAAREALNVLAEQDRIGIMVFDTRVKERLGFTNNRSEVTRELRHLVRSESFNGGTRITSSLIEAANYVQRHARADARRAIVILTDDETQDSEDELRVEKALQRANAVLSFLQAPYEPPMAGGGGGPMPGGRRGGSWPGGGGGWPGGGGGGWPGSGGGGIHLPGGLGGGGDDSHSAGTDTIARDSGGDTMSVNDAASLQETLSRLRQRYALHFYMPEEKQTQQHAVRVDLATEARIRFSDAEVRSRRVFLSGGGGSESSGPTVVTHQTAPPEPSPAETGTTFKRRRVAVNEDSTPVISTVDNSTPDTPAATTATTTTAAPAKGGWPRADQSTPPKPNQFIGSR